MIKIWWHLILAGHKCPENLVDELLRVIQSAFRVQRPPEPPELEEKSSKEAKGAREEKHLLNKEIKDEK